MKPEEVGINQLKGGSAKDAFIHWLDNTSDIQDHLMFLYRHGKGDILELGTRGGISTSALLYGIEVNGGHLWSVDFDPRCSDAFRGHPSWTFVASDSLAVDTILREGHPPRAFDLLFIDTDHTYDRLINELETWGPFVAPGGKILMHDVITFPDMARAADEYASSHDLIYTVRPGSNGLGVIQC